MRLAGGGATATTSTWTLCAFQIAESNFDELGAIFDWRIATGPDRYVAQIRAPGLYWYEIHITWTDAPFAGATLIDAMPSGSEPDYFEKQALSDQRDSSLTEWEGVHRISGMLWLPDNDTAEFDPLVQQTSGLSKSFDANSLRFLYLGPQGPSSDWRVETI